MTEILRQQQLLEKLLLSEELEELSNFTSDFNIFNALKLQNNEIRHSNFLSWLMTPYETHRLGAYFLKEFLKTAIKEFSLNENIHLGLQDIVFFNLEDAEIRREYKNIDLLVISPQNNFVCVIENKIWSGEHDCQLEKYAGIVETEFKDYKKLYIYLAPDIECNELLYRAKENVAQVYYVPMSYEQVYKALEKTLRFKAGNMTNDVRTFVEHYKKMIERNIMGNTDKKIVELCRRIYREHKEAIDLIIENNDAKSDLYQILKEVINENPNFEYITYEPNKVLCLPTNINNIDKLKFADWKPRNFIIQLNFINFTSGHKDMCFELLMAPPKNEEDNIKSQKLKDIINKKLGVKLKRDPNRWDYTQPFNLISLDDYYSYNSREEVKKHITDKLKTYENLYINGLREALNEFCES